MATSAQINSIVALYAGYFDRAPDPAGLQFWIDQIDAGRDFATIAADFAKGAEAKALYPFLTVPDVATAATFVTSVYANLFGRAPDAEGLKFWTDVITAGTVPVGDMIQRIIDGAVTAPDSTVLANKQAVGLDFATDAGNVAGFTLDTASLAAAKAAMDGVTADAASVTAAQAATDAFFAGATTGSTQALTISVDALTGTNLNDTFNATPVNATSGAAASTLTAFDKIDGGDGKDTLNIIMVNDGGAKNNALPSGAEVKNVEVINFLSTDGTTFGAIDASKFVGSTELWQIGQNAATVNNVASTQTIGANGTPAGTVTVNMLAAATSFTGAGKNVAEGSTLNVLSGATGTLNAVTVSGTVADTNSDGTIAAGTLNVTVGKDVEALTVNTTGKTTLAVTNGAGTKAVSTVDASASTGGITYTGAAATVTTIKTGAGADAVTSIAATLKDDAATTTVDETKSALIETGAGNDTATIATTGTGTTTVNAGDGNDAVTVNAKGSGVLTVNLGAGDDSINGTAVIGAKDVIDGGEGSDTLLLSSVGAANIGAFSNFEVFDVVGLNKTLDVDILASKNTVTEFVASGDTGGAAVLTNVGADVGLRVTGDTPVANVTTLTQKAAGAMTVTLDIDEPATTAAATTTASTAHDAAVTATNATSLKAVFDSAFKDAATGAGDNVANLVLAGTKAATLEVVSGGAFASNKLDYTSGVSATATKDLLTSITITGDRALDLAVTESGAAATQSQVASINASALTGALTVSTAELKAESAANTFDGGVLTFGGGNDVVTLTTGSSIASVGKGTAEDATTQSGFDVLKFGAAAVQAADVAATATHTVKDGLFTFNGAGPATLADAITAVTAVTAANEAVVFQYLSNSYLSVDGVGVVELEGMTGLLGVDTVGATNDLYLI